MNRHLATIASVALVACASTAASAHAFLEHAVPGVGSTVGSSPAELELSVTQSIVPALSRVTMASGGGAVAVGKATGSGNTLHVRFGRALPPGTYTVTWHVVSVDTHPTSGSYRFTVAP